ncbi:MAG: transcriptional regulator, LysR family, partial [Rhodoferax sp.]|nr:transcriptional regulator, LysR family [Rhodoferax sp.]
MTLPPTYRHPATGHARLAASFDIRTLATFARVVEQRGFSSAARSLHMTQPAVSLAVRQLETDLGAVLLDRSTRPLRATAAGTALYQRAIRILAEVQALDDTLRPGAMPARPGMRIGIVASVTALGAPLILALQALSDELRIWSTLTPVLAAALRDRELDMLITSEGTTELLELERRRIMEEPFVLAMPAAFAGMHPNQTLASLSQTLPFIRYTGRSNIGAVIERHLQRRRLPVPRRLEFDTSASVVEMVKAGLGWAIVTPLCLVESGVDMEALAVQPLDGPPLSRELLVLGRPRELPGMTDRVRDVVAALLRELLRDRLRGPQAWMH